MINYSNMGNFWHFHYICVDMFALLSSGLMLCLRVHHPSTNGLIRWVIIEIKDIHLAQFQILIECRDNFADIVQEEHCSTFHFPCVSSEVRGAPPSPLTYAKTAKIRGGGTPHAKISTSLSFGGQQLNDSLGKNQVLELQISKAARVLNSGLRKWTPKAAALTVCERIFFWTLTERGKAARALWP